MDGNPRTPELSAPTSSHAKESARTLFRIGRNSFESAKNAKVPNRTHFLSDVRRGKGFRSPSCIYDLFGASAPPMRWRNLKDIEFAVAIIPLPPRFVYRLVNIHRVCLTARPRDGHRSFRPPGQGGCLSPAIQTIHSARLYRSSVAAQYGAPRELSE